MASRKKLTRVTKQRTGLRSQRQQQEENATAKSERAWETEDDDEDRSWVPPAASTASGSTSEPGGELLSLMKGSKGERSSCWQSSETYGLLFQLVIRFLNQTPIASLISQRLSGGTMRSQKFHSTSVVRTLRTIYCGLSALPKRGGGQKGSGHAGSFHCYQGRHWRPILQWTRRESTAIET